MILISCRGKPTDWQQFLCQQMGRLFLLVRFEERVRVRTISGMTNQISENRGRGSRFSAGVRSLRADYLNLGTRR